MEFKEKIAEIIHESKAYKNDFFENCRKAKQIEVEEIADYCKNWYFVTKHFAIAGLEYNYLLGQKLKYEVDITEKEKLQKALLESLRINSEDFGLGLQSLGNPSGPKGIHYAMFGTIGEKIGVSSQELDEIGYYDLETETTKLIETIEHIYKDPIAGSACYRVVEGIAYNIVESQLPLFLGVEENGRKVFSKQDLVYVTLHLEIEKRHDEQSEGMIGLLGTTPERQKKITLATIGLCERFAKYWEKMNKKTFG